MKDNTPEDKEKKVNKELIKRELAHEIKSKKIRDSLNIEDPKKEKIGNKDQKINLKLSEFNTLDDKEQYKKIEDILKKMYGKTFDVNEKLILKCVKLTFRKKDAVVYLPYNLLVEKNKNNLSFSFSKAKNVNRLITIWIINFFIFAAITAAFTAVALKSRSFLNIDINGDGIAEVNLDLNNDGIAEINIDTNGDKKPDTNIDYKNNRLSVFNIDTNNDGKPDYNLMNQDLDNDGICDLNCDTDDDGWPDINIDLDGDGKADVDIDKNKDGIPDMNIDRNGDGVCDLMCDTDDDGICDLYCYQNPTDRESENRPGDVIIIGDPSNDIGTAALQISFVDDSNVYITDLFPDDQDMISGIGEGQEVLTKVPDKVFTIQNLSSYTLRYSLKWEIHLNDYVSDNFKYRVLSTNGGGSIPEFITAPKQDTVFIKDVLIYPKTIQKYTISFKLQGVKGMQNYDQGRTFSASIKVGY